MVGTPFHHLSDVLSLLVDRHGADDSSLRGRGHHFDLDGARLCNLAVQLLQFSGILLRDGPVVEGRKEPSGDIVTGQIRARNYVYFYSLYTCTLTLGHYMYNI